MKILFLIFMLFPFVTSAVGKEYRTHVEYSDTYGTVITVSKLCIGEKDCREKINQSVKIAKRIKGVKLTAQYSNVKTKVILWNFVK